MRWNKGLKMPTDGRLFAAFDAIGIADGNFRIPVRICWQVKATNHIQAPSFRLYKTVIMYFFRKKWAYFAVLWSRSRKELELLAGARILKFRLQLQVSKSSK
jgi:hypothetical protein